MASTDLPALIAAARDARADRELAARAIALVDLTSLRGDETVGEVEALCGRAVREGTAAVCVHAAQAGLARGLLAGGRVRLAVVANFPDGGDDIARAAEETAAAVAAGADEVDMVAPIAAIRSGDIGLVEELVAACRAAARPGITLKLILETGALETPHLITAAARAGVMAGVDFLKTSTGKIPVGATLESAALLLAVIADADGRVGFKAAGGIRTADEAAGYLLIAERLLGPAWATPQRFRFGASSLIDDLVRRAGRGESGAVPAGGY